MNIIHELNSRKYAVLLIESHLEAADILRFDTKPYNQVINSRRLEPKYYVKTRCQCKMYETNKYIHYVGI